ncbi:coq1 putative hexaprenyl diphosphate synthase [Ascosphaera acerosa]|nr:coq1 putative hexaprenyl diphosphate synthase [Ascosphaera acerosa]
MAPASATSYVAANGTICARCAYLYQRHFSSQKRRQSALGAAAAAARQILEVKTSKRNTTPSLANPSVDPLRLVASELKFLKSNMQKLIGTDHPLLARVARYYTRSKGKNLRPLLVLLMSQATSATGPRDTPRQTLLAAQSQINEAINADVVLADSNPDASPLTATHDGGGGGMDLADLGDHILPSQRRLAEIVELIHTASLMHDDVIDTAVTRRSQVSANLAFGNKMAVLAGDFLLGRASVALIRLRDQEVSELIASVIANLIEGEFMQLKNTLFNEAVPQFSNDVITYYLRKTYLKSASLISKSCRAAALLGHCRPEVIDAAYLYGRNLGLAFQLVDDMLDYTVDSDELGKPAGADLELGLATAPLLLAWKDKPELGPLVGRNFAHEGDVQLARRLVAESDGVEQTRALAQRYADDAVAAISFFPDTPAKQELAEICRKATSRRK